MPKHFHQLMIIAALFITPLACTRELTAISPQVPPAPTPTPTSTPLVPITVSVIVGSGYQYLSGGVTLSSSIGMNIAVGQSVIWDTSNSGIHPLYLDNGSTCLVTNNFSYPLTQTFNTAGTYNFHCGFHGGCAPSNGTCPLPAASCSGLVGFIVVQ